MERKITLAAEDLARKIGEGSFKLMQVLAEKGLEAYNQGNYERYNLANENYKASRNVAKHFGIDVSKYPETLEELIK